MLIIFGEHWIVFDCKSKVIYSDHGGFQNSEKLRVGSLQPFQKPFSSAQNGIPANTSDKFHVSHQNNDSRKPENHMFGVHF